MRSLQILIEDVKEQGFSTTTDFLDLCGFVLDLLTDVGCAIRDIEYLERDAREAKYENNQCD
jgi:hypothetical protein